MRAWTTDSAEPVDPRRRRRHELREREEHVAVTDLLLVHAMDGVQPPDGGLAAVAARTALVMLSKHQIRVVVPRSIFVWG